jgi:hypothetical protein
VAELNAGHNGILLNQGVAVASVRNLQLVDTECVWNNKVCLVGCRVTLLLQEESVVGV